MEETLETNVLIQPRANNDVVDTETLQSEEDEPDESQSKKIGFPDGDAYFQQQASNNNVAGTAIESINLSEPTLEVSRFINNETAKACDKEWQSNEVTDKVTFNSLQMEEILKTNILIRTQTRNGDIATKTPQSEEINALNQSSVSDVVLINFEIDTVVIEDTTDDEGLTELKLQEDIPRSLKSNRERAQEHHCLQEEKKQMKAKEKTVIHKNHIKTATEQHPSNSVAYSSSQTFIQDSKPSSRPNKIASSDKEVQEPMRKGAKRSESVSTRDVALIPTENAQFLRFTAGQKHGFQKAPENGMSKENDLKHAKIPPIIKLGVMSANEDRCPLTKHHLTAIEEAVIDVMIELKHKSNKPKFLGNEQFVENFKSSWLYFICANDTTVSWMHNNFWKIKTKCDLDLRLVKEKYFPKIKPEEATYKINGYFPHSSRISQEKILETISAQNDINTTKWNVLSKIINDTTVQLVMSIDNASMNALVAKKGNISYRFSQIKLELEEGMMSSNTEKSHTSVLNSCMQDNINWDSSTSKADTRPLKRDRVSAFGGKDFRAGIAASSKDIHTTHTGGGRKRARPMRRSLRSNRSSVNDRIRVHVPNNYLKTENDFEHRNARPRAILMEPYRNEPVTSVMPRAVKREYEPDYDSIRYKPKSETYRSPRFNREIFTSTSPYSTRRAFGYANRSTRARSAFDSPPPPPAWI